MAEKKWGVYITEQTGKYFRVVHHYAPTPNPDEPSTYDDEVTKSVGIAETREQAERIMKEYESELKVLAEKEEDEDDG